LAWGGSWDLAECPMRQGLSRLFARETMARNLGRDSFPIAVFGARILGIASQLLLFVTGLGYGLMAVSKLTAFLVHMFILQCSYYYEQFVYVHIGQNKTGQNNSLSTMKKVTPAMCAKVTDHIWSVIELLTARVCQWSWTTTWLWESLQISRTPSLARLEYQAFQIRPASHVQTIILRICCMP
jgi:hypothetical protein